MLAARSSMLGRLVGARTGIGSGTTRGGSRGAIAARASGARGSGARSAGGVRLPSQSVAAGAEAAFARAGSAPEGAGDRRPFVARPVGAGCAAGRAAVLLGATVGFLACFAGRAGFLGRLPVRAFGRAFAGFD